MKKKLLTIVMTVAMVCTFAACGSQETGNQDSREPATSEATPAPAETTPAPTDEKEPATQASDSTGASDSKTTGDTSLADFVESDDMQQMEKSVNDALAQSGAEISVDFVADGNILVVKYSLTDEYNDLEITEEQAAQTFDPAVKDLVDSFADLFDNLDSLGITVDGGRVEVLTGNGRELYSVDVEK